MLLDHVGIMVRNSRKSNKVSSGMLGEVCKTCEGDKVESQDGKNHQCGKNAMILPQG